ncbi:hypothetical protein [Hippea alviniae]|uniref:hypothetical protein n=1 Tax=Hippea alviniae TaxID=1279027 RepID=UPI0003B4FC54|nr:hypothetical protein [Hippea alviniae]
MRKIFFMVVALLFVSRISFASLTTYELVGTVANPNHQSVVKNVKSALESAGFKVLTSYNPGDLADLTVLIVKSDEFFNAVNKAGKHAFFAVPLRVGIQKTKSGNSVMFANPVYLVDAFAKGKDSLESVAEKVKNELENALSKVKGIKVEKKAFGYKTDPEEIGNWQMMGQSLYTIYEVGHKYGSIDAALKALNDSLSKGTNGWKKVYEIKLGKAAVVGVANPKYEKEAFEIGGYDHLCAFPIELVIYDNGKIKALPEMYRMSLYFMDAGMSAFAAHMSMPGEIDDSLKGLLK